MTDQTLLLRQIHPAFVHEGFPTYIAFRPFPKDRGLLSVYDGDLIKPAAAFRHYTSERHLKSAGVMSVSVQECASIDLPAASSPEEFREHAHIDFCKLDKKQVVSRSKSLLEFASTRGWTCQAKYEETPPC